MIVVPDLETTGLMVPNRDWSLQPGITQIGVVKLDDDLNEVGHYVTLVNPEIAEGGWSKESIEITGIKPSDVINAPTLFAVMHDLTKFMLGSRIWCGWNMDFDQKVLQYQLQRYGFERGFPWPPQGCDVMKVTTRVLEMKGKKGMKHPKLEEAYEACVGGKFQAHDALADVRATAAVMRSSIVRPYLGI